MRKKAYIIWFPLFWFVVCGSIVKANVVYPLEIFTSDGEYHDSPDLNLYVEVSNAGTDQVNFTFYNESLIDSSVARIYFDDGFGSLLGIANIEGLGTSFGWSATPKNLPGAELLEPLFEATDEFSIGGDAPPPKNGVNPGEWVQLTFDIKINATLEDVVAQLDTGAIRIGTHVIALPDGSSGSAIAVPEPGTLMLFGTAGLWILTRKKKLV